MCFFYVKVSCPGVWLCQDGRVSLTVFALGTSYQTCMLPPMFPLTFRDVFYFRKRFQESCTLSNICCLLRDETIYCELVQWCQDCATSECVILAQYLGSLNEVLFPPNMCSNDGVDLLMRRAKDFPGILAPKIEITTKVRIDEVWNEPTSMCYSAMKLRPCHCSSVEGSRQKPVCHSAQYHRKKCYANSPKRPLSITKSRSRSRSRSAGSRSCGSFVEPKDEPRAQCSCPNPISKSGVRMRLTSPRKSRRPCRRDYCVYNMEMPKVDQTWRGAADSQEYDELKGTNEFEENTIANEDRMQKLILESRYIDEGGHERHPKEEKHEKTKKYDKINIKPCICEICKRYHELFHAEGTKTC
ncbi:uncharacterized protein isoform X2 [Choristoneura fumiferana]|uniref:uncharacterized protein isoform X2 n=1 Tax=Choristoneura fumiferana TaxID=7141 RepID=UPI003D15E1D8